MAEACATRYRARNPRATPLYRLFETHFDEVRGQWEKRFERRCGFWRGFVDEQVRRYLVRYYGAYSNVSRGKRSRQDETNIGAALPDGRDVPSV